MRPVAVAEMEEDDQVFNLALEARLHAAETIKQSRQELIVVASLVDRIPNLAGLTRTCEVFFHTIISPCLSYLVGANAIKSRVLTLQVFRAAGLVVADKSVLQDKQFRLIRFGWLLDCLLP
jgi:hypothetical protein